MKINLITPAKKQSKSGNRNTAVRWARLIRELGHQVSIAETYNDKPFDAMIALHAWRSAESIERFHLRYPRRPLIVALTGTDIYRFQKSHPKICNRSMELADQLVCLHDLVHQDIPKRFRSKLDVIHQFAQPLPGPREPRKRYFDVCVVGHLRMEKDPLRAAYAVRDVPADSRLRVTQLGKAHDESWAQKAREEMARNPRYTWRGEVSYAAVRREYQKTHVMVMSSVMEGGANVISEAAVAGVPIIASNIPGNIGLIGKDHPGIYAVKNTQALQKLLLRAEQDPRYLGALTQRSKKIANKFTPTKERDSWRRVLAKF
ncbi:MAG: selenoneine biosynthesis selenosugar synthase SenB [Rhodospirillaceae bacterium]|jgi:putative glycosyltransferase (TIGR04348 family)